MTAEYVRPVSDSECDAESFWRMCEEFAGAGTKDEVVQALRMGRMTALQKSAGGVRRIVDGDFLRRLVARTLTQQLAPAVERAIFARSSSLSLTKSGCECVAHIAQTLTDLDGNTTLLICERHWCVRSHLSKRYVARIAGGGRWICRSPFREAVPRFCVDVLVG